MPCAAPGELTSAEAHALLDDLARFEPRPHVILTGGDPLVRPDLLELIAAATARGLAVSVSPAATPLLTADRIGAMKEAGAVAMSLSLDGATAASHDGLRRVPGTFERTLRAAREILAEGIVLQVNTLVAAQTLDELPRIHELVRELGVDRWSLFFLVQTGRGSVLAPIEPDECDRLAAWIGTLRGARPIVTTTEAPHFRRISLQAMRRRGALHSPAMTALRRAFGIRDGNGVAFISHDGDVQPSGFLPITAGNVRQRSVVDIYRESPIFTALRDPGQLEGRCGRCEFRFVCGGSRARAFAATGNPLASDPLCTWEPRTPHP
jgi:radical SAM protein